MQAQEVPCFAAGLDPLGAEPSIRSRSPAASALDQNAGAKLYPGGAATDTIFINVNVKGSGQSRGLGAFGIWAYNGDTENTGNGGGYVQVQGKTLRIDVHSESGQAFGLYAQNGSAKSEVSTPASVIVDAEKTIANAIVARGGAVVAVNEADRSDVTVVLDGDVNFNDDKTTSGTTADADVTVNPTNAASSRTGSGRLVTATAAAQSNTPRRSPV